MKKREASRRETSALDKSREAVIVRVKALFDEADRQFDGRKARQAREARRPKLVFPDPETVGFNLPDHLVGNSEDYRTEERSPGLNKDGFTPKEVSRTNAYTNSTYMHTQTYICSRFGHKTCLHFRSLCPFTFPFSLFL